MRTQEVAKPARSQSLGRISSSYSLSLHLQHSPHPFTHITADRTIEIGNIFADNTVTEIGN